PPPSPFPSPLTHPRPSPLLISQPLSDEFSSERNVDELGHDARPRGAQRIAQPLQLGAVHPVHLEDALPERPQAPLRGQFRNFCCPPLSGTRIYGRILF